jgi:hypothetical protein
MSYQHKPGNVKAKEREERKRRQEAELQRISKIQNFFTPATCAPNTDSLSLPTSTEHVNVEPSESLLNTPDALDPATRCDTVHSRENTISRPANFT